MKKKRYFSRTVCFILCAVFALLFLLPTVLTITNSFMTQSENSASSTASCSWALARSRWQRIFIPACSARTRSGAQKIS